MRLLQPQHTMEILDQSSSIVGISVMSSQAAAAGPATFLSFAALISFSLGFMNLLPIPPLDGGKLVIEIIQKIAGRELPLKVQTIVSYVGIALLRCCLSICFVPTSFDLFCRGVFGLSLSHPLPRELTAPCMWAACRSVAARRWWSNP
ncbi:MAG: site-2 protease family protein [Collinsella sp.]